MTDFFAHLTLEKGESPLQGGPITSTWQLFSTAWEWHPSVVIGCLLVMGLYLLATRFAITRTMWLFAIGIISTMLALVSPLDPLSDHYLFSAHMSQHILIDMMAPAFFVLGISSDLAQRMLRTSWVAKTERILGHPMMAWWLGNLTLWLWHWPSLYNATIENETVHILEHVTFLVTGTIFWWPVFSPPDKPRMNSPQSLIYLLLAAIPNALLGILFTFSSSPWYSAYDHPEDEIGALSLIRNSWKLDQLTDQQLGGTIMWVFGSIIYLWVILAMVIRWLNEEEKSQIQVLR